MSKQQQASDERNLVRWLFEDRATGEIVVAQFPNVTLWVFIAAFVTTAVLKPGGMFGTAVHVVQLGALTIWALDEIVRGANPWRKILGGFVLGIVAAQWFDR